MGVKDESVGALLASVASPTEAPGGGSMSALAGAVGAALAQFVAGLARGRKGYEMAERDLAEIESRAAELQEGLLVLVERDAKAYEAVLAALHRPKTTEAEKAARVAAIQAAYQDAARVPLQTMDACARVLDLAAQALERGHRGATTDAAVAILLAEAGLRGADLNVRVNLASIRDESFRTASEEEARRLLAQGTETARVALRRADERLTV